MKKTVTRTYYNKKLGEFVTKTYEYEYSKAKTSPLFESCDYQIRFGAGERHQTLRSYF